MDLVLAAILSVLAMIAGLAVSFAVALSVIISVLVVTFGLRSLSLSLDRLVKLYHRHVRLASLGGQSRKLATQISARFEARS